MIPPVSMLHVAFSISFQYTLRLLPLDHLFTVHLTKQTQLQYMNHWTRVGPQFALFFCSGIDFTVAKGEIQFLECLLLKSGYKMITYFFQMNVWILGGVSSYKVEEVYLLAVS
ncbi:hypothetical protein Tco_1064178, partial [Tanacetum coccineum]